MALAELELIRQRSDEPFHAFIVRFESKLARAGGLHWEGSMKLIKLKHCISLKIKQTAAGRGISLTNYTSAVGRYREIATDLETLRLEEKFHHGHRKRSENKTGQERDVEGDITMTGINATRTQPQRGGQRRAGGKPQGGKGPKAVWVDKETITKRREDGLCLRCGKDGHFVNKCRFSPADRPVGVNALKAEGWEDTSSSSADEEEQGKE